MFTATPFLNLVLLPSLALASEVPKGSFQRMTKAANGSAVNGNSVRPAISGNGKKLAISTCSSNFGCGTYNGFRQVVGIEAKGSMLGSVAKMIGGQLANDDCWNSRLSKSGRYVAFESDSTFGLVGPPGGSERVFWRDTKTGALRHVSIGPSGNVANQQALVEAISDDGRYVLFRTASTNMVANDNAHRFRGFLHDTQTGDTEIVTLNDQGLPLDGHLSEIAMSGDARFVYFTSNAQNLGNNSVVNVYVRDRKLGTTKLVTKSPAGAPGADESCLMSCSRNGRYALISTTATNLGFALKPGGMVLFDRETSELRAIDLSMPGMSDTFYTALTTISNDGRRVLTVAEYMNAENDLSVPGIFEFDLKTGDRFTVVSDPGSDLNTSLLWVSASANGEWAFLSTSVGLQESNGKYDGDLYCAL